MMAAMKGFVACLVIFMEVLDTAADPAADAVAADLRVR
jgi:hypothetical protein